MPTFMSWGAAPPDEVVDAVRSWFSVTKLAHLDLPGRTIGRPGDDLFELTSVFRDGDALTLVLGDRHALTIRQPTVAVGEHEATFQSATAVTLRLRRVGEVAWSDEVLRPGPVRLWERGPLPRVSPEPWQVSRDIPRR